LSRHTYTTQQTDYLTWTTKLVGKKKNSELRQLMELEPASKLIRERRFRNHNNTDWMKCCTTMDVNE